MMESIRCCFEMRFLQSAYVGQQVGKFRLMANSDML